MINRSVAIEHQILEGPRARRSGQAGEGRADQIQARIGEALTSSTDEVFDRCRWMFGWHRMESGIRRRLSRPVRALAYDRLLNVSGTLEIGIETDAKTGFVSLVRLRDATYTKV